MFTRLFLRYRSHYKKYCFDFQNTLSKHELLFFGITLPLRFYTVARKTGMLPRRVTVFALYKRRFSSLLYFVQSQSVTVIHKKREAAPTLSAASSPFWRCARRRSMPVLRVAADEIIWHYVRRTSVNLPCISDESNNPANTFYVYFDLQTI